jgi:chemotaxis protein MotA
MLLGIAIAVAALVGGLIATGVKLSYFFQPTGVCIVLGGTLGVIFITTPRENLVFSAQRVQELFRPVEINREALIEEIMSLVKLARSRGLLMVEPMLDRVSNSFLKESLSVCLESTDRSELRGMLETRLRLRERQGETDAKVLEVAGGFAPTIGVLGTVVGLIDVLRSFSDLSSVAGGIGAAFVSTIYGLALANVVLLPAAHRIRARVAETFEIHELITEGVVSMAEGIHPSLVRERLNAFLRETK